MDISKSDAKLVLQEICTILQISTDDYAELIETVRKIERVVKAVPRMEGFISNLCKELVMEEDHV